MNLPNADPLPINGRNTLERVAPYEFVLRKAIGGQVMARTFQVRAIPEMEQDDLVELYGDATVGENNTPAEVVFLAKSRTSQRFFITLNRAEDGKYIARKNDIDGHGSGMTFGGEECLRGIHEYFTLDFEYGDRETSHISMGYDKDGNPEIIEFREVTPDDLFSENETE